MTTFTPTHLTVRAIGKIKAGSKIRVARYDDTGFFSDLLGQLGDKEYISYRYDGEDVVFRDDREEAGPGKTVVPGDYVITDGNYFETSETGSGWHELPVGTAEGLTFYPLGDDLYILRGDGGGVITVTSKQLHNLVESIHNRVPKPSPIKDARFIHARLAAVNPGEYRTLAKVDDLWYDDNGNEYTEEQVLDNYDEIEVIR